MIKLVKNQVKTNNKEVGDLAAAVEASTMELTQKKSLTCSSVVVCLRILAPDNREIGIRINSIKEEEGIKVDNNSIKETKILYKFYLGSLLRSSL